MTRQPTAYSPHRRAAPYPILTVGLSARLVARAEEYERAVLANLPPTPNPDGFYPPHRFRNGYLGEWAFVTLLQRRGYRVDYEPQTRGCPDEGPDVFVWVDGHRQGVQVRTGGKVTHQNVMMPESQWQRCPGADLYLGAKLDLDGDAGRCELWGTVWREGFALAPVRRPGDDGFPRVLVPTRLLPLRDLEPLARLLPSLAYGPATIRKAIP